MVGVDALDKRHGLREYRHITLQYSFHIVGCGKLPALEPVRTQVRIDDSLLGYSRIYFQAFVLLVVFRMMHSN